MVAKPTVLVLLVVLSVYGRSLDFSSTLNRSLSCLVLLPQYVTSADEVWHPLVDLDDAPMKHVYSDRGELNTTLTVDVCTFSAPQLNITVRCYNGGSPGPAIHVRPGDTLRITLINDLGTDTSLNGTINELQYPNSTNLHLHGLHIDAHEDNVFIKVAPGENYTYVYHIPSDHAPGVFWYHAHLHGSSAYQTTGGMVGAVIVDGYVGDFLGEIPAHLMLLNEWKMMSYDQDSWHGYIEYDNLIHSSIETNFDFYDRNPLFLNSHTVNGEFQPYVTHQPDEWMRFQIINAAASLTLDIAVDGENVSSCESYVVGIDGVLLDDPTMGGDTMFITAGGRLEMLMKCSDPGFYRFFSSQNFTHSGQMYTGVDKPCVEDIIYIVLEGDTVSSLDIGNYDPPPRPLYLQDIYDVDDDLIADTFNISASFLNASTDRFAFNDVQWSGDGNYQFYMELGRIYEFTIYSPDGQVHPVHIHVNHMQVVSDTYVENTLPGIDNDTDETFEIYQPGEWRDTILATYLRKVVVRYKPMDHTGPVLVHCHYIQHADRGMMMELYIQDPISDDSSIDDN